MAPCHSLPLKESGEVCAEHSGYQIGESLTKKINKRASLLDMPARYVGNNDALDANGDVMISYIPNSIKTSPPCNFLIGNT